MKQNKIKYTLKDRRKYKTFFYAGVKTWNEIPKQIWSELLHFQETGAKWNAGVNYFSNTTQYKNCSIVTIGDLVSLISLDVKIVYFEQC